MTPSANNSVFRAANRVSAPLLIAPICLALTGCLGGAGTSSKSPSSAVTAPVVTPPTVITPTPTPTPTPDPTPAPTVDPTTQYHLTFDDEFNAWVTDRWQTADFSGMRNNGGDYQSQWFADPFYVPPGNPRVAYNPFQFANGILKIIAQPTPANTYSSDYNFPYVSGQLTSAHRFTQRYGYYELRQVAAGQGTLAPLLAASG
jgi:beta-glucanase (GH16 family)